MRLVWVVAGASVGLLGGAVVGFIVALIAMSLGPSRQDGTYGMREVLVCLPLGAVLGLVAGIRWALVTSFAGK